MSIRTTTAGRVLTGMILDPDRRAAPRCRTPATERITLAKEKSIEQVRDSPQSMMPEGQLDPLTRDQVRDLFAYLTSKSRRAAVAIDRVRLNANSLSPASAVSARDAAIAGRGERGQNRVSHRTEKGNRPMNGIDGNSRERYRSRQLPQ